MKSVSVVIPSYNGRLLLEKYLPALVRAVTRYQGDVEIIVVDDASSDDTRQFMLENYPRVIMLVNEENAGFGATINRGIHASRHEVVLALNNDILVEEDLFVKAVHRFADPTLFSVTPNIVDPRRTESQAITRLQTGSCWYRTIYLQLEDLADTDGEIPLFFGSGGASFYDREKLVRLGGFDSIYRPFYVEDVDLSYRAWKSGWKCVLEPSATVFHETSSTILNLHKKRKIKFIGDRNRTLFLWHNITDLSLIVKYFLLLPFSMLYDIIAFRKYKFAGFFMALGYLPHVAAGRRRRKSYFKMTDRDVFRIISHKKTAI
jgi:GT2 family glycosyltransferase